MMALGKNDFLFIHRAQDYSDGQKFLAYECHLLSLEQYEGKTEYIKVNNIKKFEFLWAKNLKRAFTYKELEE